MYHGLAAVAVRGIPLGHRVTCTQAELPAQAIVLLRQLCDLDQRRIEPHSQLDRVVPLRPRVHASMIEDQRDAPQVNTPSLPAAAESAFPAAGLG